MSTLRATPTEDTTGSDRKPLATLRYLIWTVVTGVSAFATINLVGLYGWGVVAPWFVFPRGFNTLDVTIAFVVGGAIAVVSWIGPFMWMFVIMNLWGEQGRVRSDLPAYQVTTILATPLALAALVVLWIVPDQVVRIPVVGQLMLTLAPESFWSSSLSILGIALPASALQIAMSWVELRELQTKGSSGDLDSDHRESDRVSTEGDAPVVQDDTQRFNTIDRSSSPDPRDAPPDSARSRVDVDDESGVDRFGDISGTPDQAGSDRFTYPWEHSSDITFNDVGGMEDVKEELRREIALPLSKDPDQLRRLGVSIPNVLLYGPPGTGKSYLAEAIAGELGYPFVMLTAGEIKSKWINESPRNVATLFDEAAWLGGKYGWAIIFVDEVDSLLLARSATYQHNEDIKVVNEFLGHLERTTERNTLFLCATNHPEVLDSAAIRDGRIDKKILIGHPDRDDRVDIFKAQLARRSTANIDEDDLVKFAELLGDSTAATIGKIVKQAGLRALQRDATEIELVDLEAEVYDVVSESV